MLTAHIYLKIFEVSNFENIFPQIFVKILKKEIIFGIQSYYGTTTIIEYLHLFNVDLRLFVYSTFCSFGNNSNSCFHELHTVKFK